MRGHRYGGHFNDRSKVNKGKKEENEKRKRETSHPFFFFFFFFFFLSSSSVSLNPLFSKCGYTCVRMHARKGCYRPIVDRHLKNVVRCFSLLLLIYPSLAHIAPPPLFFFIIIIIISQNLTFLLACCIYIYIRYEFMYLENFFFFIERGSKSSRTIFSLYSEFL